MRTTGFQALVTWMGASLGWILSYVPPFRWTLGPRGRFWEPLRRFAAGPLGRGFDERAGPRDITYGEYAGRFEGTLTEVESSLWKQGFRRNPLSRPKTRGGIPEAGSWAHRPSPVAARQVHIMLFPVAEREGAGEPGNQSPALVDIYAHEEASSVNPRVAAAHFDGHSMRVATGVERARSILPLDTGLAPEDVPDGHWTAKQRDHPPEIPAERCQDARGFGTSS